MNGKNLRMSSLVLTVLVLLAGLLATAVAAGGNPSASGHANLVARSPTTGEEGLRTFSFTAVQQADGTVIGEGEVNNRSFPIRVHFKIDCIKVEGDNRAIMSGPVTQSSDPSTVGIGRIAVFGVEDNGEGSNASADRITTIPDYDPPKSCSEFTFVGDELRDAEDVRVRILTPIEDGNIQVRP